MSAAPPTSRIRAGRLRLGGAVGLYRIRFRRRWVQELLAVVGIAVGVALLYASQVASTSLSGPVRTITHGLVGQSQLQLLSRGATGLPANLYERVVGIPGVRRAAPVLQMAGNVQGPRGQRGVIVFGADPRIVRLKGNILKGFSSEDAAQEEAVVIPTPIAKAIGVGVGDDIRLQLDGRTVVQPVIVSGRDEIGALTDTSIVLIPLAYLQRLTRAKGQVTRILVQAEPGHVSDVRASLIRLSGGRWDVTAADFETKLFDKAASPTTRGSLIFAIVSALVGFLFATCALLVTAGERRKLAEHQHNLGYPPASTLLTLMVDVAVIGGLGVVIGLGLGELISRAGFSSDVSYLAGAFPMGDVRVVTWQSVVAAAGAGLLAATVGVLAPVRRSVFTMRPFHFMPSDPSREAAELLGGRSMEIVAVCFIASAAAIDLLLPSGVLVGLAALGAGMVCALPAIVSGTARVARWLNLRARRTSSALVLALQQVEAPQLRSRTLAIATVGAVAVFGAASLEGARLNLTAGLSDDVHALNAAAPIWITPRGAGDVYGTIPFDAHRVDAAVQRAQGVGRVDVYRAGLVDVGLWRAWMIGTPTTSPAPLPASQVVDGDAREATRRLRQGGWVTLSKALADNLHASVGDSVTLPTPRPLQARVAAITSNLGWSAGAIVASEGDFASGWRGHGVAALQVTPSAGTTAALLQPRLMSAVGGSSAALRVETSQQRDARQLRSGLSGLKRLQQIARLTLLAGLLAMSAAMTGLLVQHRSNVAAFKAHGLTTGLLWASLLIEAVILFVSAAATGAIFSLLGQDLASRGLQVLTGFPVDRGLQVTTTIESVALVAGVSLAAVVVPGYLVARVGPRWKG